MAILAPSAQPPTVVPLATTALRKKWNFVMELPGRPSTPRREELFVPIPTPPTQHRSMGKIFIIGPRGTVTMDILLQDVLATSPKPMLVVPIRTGPFSGPMKRPIVAGQPPAPMEASHGRWSLPATASGCALSTSAATSFLSSLFFHRSSPELLDWTRSDGIPTLK